MTQTVKQRKAAAYMRQWTADNREKARESSRISARKFRVANPELCRERAKASKRLKPHLARKSCADRRARKLNATPSWLTQEQHDVMEALYASAHVTKMHVDHIVPLRGNDVCGLHVPWNMQLLQPEANMAKGNSVTL